MLFQILFIFLLLVVLAAKKFSRKVQVPAVSPLLFTNSQTALPNLLKFVLEKNAKAVEVRGGNIVFLTHPDSIRDAIKNDVSTYSVVHKWPPGTPMDLLLTNGLIFVNGEQWRHQRLTCTPAFQFDSLKAMTPVFVSKTQEMISLLGDYQKDVEIGNWIHKFNLDSIGEAMFGMNFGIMKGEQGIYQQAFYELLHCKFPPIEILFPQFARVPTTENIARAKLVSLVLEMNAKMIEQRKKYRDPSRYTDVLDVLVQSDLTEVEISNLITSFFLAGHDTTANSLCWAFHYMAKYPEYQDKLYDEIMKNIGDGKLTYEKVKNLTFMGMFLKEVLRLCPPAPQLDVRHANETTEVNGILIPPNVQISASMWVVHRLPEFWPNPENFDPYRFTTENCKARHSYAYLPFSSGKRACIGKQFSLLQQKTFLAMMIRKYRIYHIRDAIGQAGIFYQPDAVHVGLQSRL